MSDARFGWLASYPRSGNTWLRMLLGNLAQSRDAAAFSLHASIASRREFDAYMGVESDLLLDSEIDGARPAFHRILAANSDSPLILRKVHDRCWVTAGGERVFAPDISRGAVYVARDPRDVAVSCADFFDLGLDETIRRMNDPAAVLARSGPHGFTQLPQPLGAWSQHVASWLDESEMPVLLVRYEDLIDDAVGALSRIATFLGLSDDGAAAAVGGVAFERLRTQEAKAGFVEQPRASKRFFRRGRAGAWRDTLSAVQADRLQQDHGRVMARLGYS